MPKKSSIHFKEFVYDKSIEVIPWAICGPNQKTRNPIMLIIWADRVSV